MARDDDVLLGSLLGEWAFLSLKRLDEEELLKKSEGEEDLPLPVDGSCFPSSNRGLLSLCICVALCGGPILKLNNEARRFNERLVQPIQKGLWCVSLLLS